MGAVFSSLLVSAGKELKSDSSFSLRKVYGNSSLFATHV